MTNTNTNARTGLFLRLLNGADYYSSINSRAKAVEIIEISENRNRNRVVFSHELSPEAIEHCDRLALMLSSSGNAYCKQNRHEYFNQLIHNFRHGISIRPECSRCGICDHFQFAEGHREGLCKCHNADTSRENDIAKTCADFIPPFNEQDINI